jgi:FK506-binding protein 2
LAIGGATLVFDTELIAVNGKTSGGGTADESNSEL